MHADAAIKNGVNITAARDGRSSRFSFRRDQRNNNVMRTASVKIYGRPRANRVVQAGAKTDATSNAPSQASGRRNHGKAHNIVSSIRLVTEKTTSVSASPPCQRCM